MKEFINLHNHTDLGGAEVAAQDSVVKIEDLVKRAKELGQKAVAVTDHGSISAWVKFATACEKYNIKPIFGVEMYEAPEEEEKAKYYHSVFLAKNEKGRKAIQRLVTEAYKDCYYGKPRYSISYLEENKDEFNGNVIWLSGCVIVKMSKLILEQKEDKAREYLRRMVNIFGSENTFVEIQNHFIKDEEQVLPVLCKIAKTEKVDIVATNDTHFLRKEDYIARSISLARRRGYTINKYGEPLYGAENPNNKELYFKSREEMEKVIPFNEALDNTVKIADMIERISLKETIWHYPKLKDTGDKTVEEIFEEKVWEGVNKRYKGEEREKIKERTEYEIKVIEQMNAAAYMLIDADFTVKGKELMRVGPGRGSACGSVVAYALGITDVEPVKYDLFFERFMNPERVSMPDIDSDFQDTKREEIIKYMVDTYGADKVARIITFSACKPRVAIRDTGAVLDLNAKLIDKVAKSIPNEMKITIDKALEKSPEFREFYDNNEEAKLLIDLAKTIEGTIRQTSSHAAGLIVSDKPLTEYGSLIQKDDDVPIFCYDMADVEFLHLIKFDFLGLKTLSVLDETVELIKRDIGKTIDLQKISLKDKKTFKMISEGNTNCVFQLESEGMQSFMKQLKPVSIEDLILGVAVYRPGPMDSIPEICAGKEDAKNIKYPKDAEHIMKPILDVTYGVLVYQEEVMQLARELAGYSFGRADPLRRAMSKKKTDVMEYERNVFIYGEVVCPKCNKGKKENGDNCEFCSGKGKVPGNKATGEYTVKGAINNGISEKTAIEIYDKIYKFAEYAFNKSHATAYALIAYQTAYLKAHYPRQYMTAYLNSISDPQKLKKYIGVAKKEEHKILPPNRYSEVRFSEDENGIRMGLSTIKSINATGEEISQALKNAETLEDFLLAYKPKKAEFEKLARVGVFDDFGYTRSTLIGNIDRIVSVATEAERRKEEGQLSLFDEGDKIEMDFDIKEIPEFNMGDILSMEKELTGFYLSGHPLSLPDFKAYTKRSTITTMDDFDTKDSGREITIVGIIDFDEKKEGVKYSKSNKKYATFSIEDIYSDIKVLAFGETAEMYEKYIEKGNVVEIVGKLKVEKTTVENPDGETIEQKDVVIFVDKIIPKKKLSECSRIWVQAEFKKFPNLYQKLNLIPGDDILIFCDKTDKSKTKFYQISGSSDLIEQIKNLVGEENLVVEKR